MLEGQLSLLGTMIGAYFADGEFPRPMGNAYEALVPYQTFHTKTRDLALADRQREAVEEILPGHRLSRADRRSPLSHALPTATSNRDDAHCRCCRKYF